MTYRFLRALFRLSMRGFFRTVDVQGRELIPEQGPVLFVANHTNAFVDPLVVLTKIERRVTITAKATLAKRPWAAMLLKGFGVILLHRARDRGEDAPAPGNVTALGRAVRLLRDGGALFVFPEGVSHSDPAMRGFKSGAARIVADYLKDESAPALRIVPIGLHFSQKDRWRSDAIALVGEPIDAREWAGGDMDVPALTTQMKGWVEALTMNFQSAEERDLLGHAHKLLAFAPEGPATLDRRGDLDARAHVALVHRLQRGAHELRQRDPERFEALAADTGALARDLEALGVEAHEVSLPMHLGRVALFLLREVEVLLVGAPLALAGSLLHAVPLTATRRLVRSMSEDEDHPASNAVFLSIPIFLTWWLMLDVVALFTLGLGIAVTAAFVVPFAGLVNLHFRDRAGGVIRRVRTFLLWLRCPDLRADLEDRIRTWQEHVREAEAESGGPFTPGPEAPDV